MATHWQRYLLAVCCLILLLIPVTAWGNLYMVGGDDSRLYYLFPKEYLTNYLFHVISNNTTGNTLGYFPVSFSAPIVAYLFVLKTLLPSVNTQMIAYGSILSAGFLFFYLFTEQLIQKKSAFTFWSGITASLMYVFSPYLVSTLYSTQLIPIFLVAAVPAVLYFFTRGIRERSSVYIILAALTYSLFSATVYGLPWFLPVCIVLLPYLWYLSRGNGSWFWRGAVVFVAALILFNFYWIVHLIIPLVLKTGEQSLATTLTSAALKRENDDVIVSLTYLNSPINQLIGFLRTSWNDRSGTTIWNAAGSVYLLSILIGGVLLRAVRKRIRTVFLTATACLILSMAFITPNFGIWNLKLFTFLNDHIPLFSMFRNMYDKFALAFAFSVSFALFSSLVVIGEKINLKAAKYLLIGLLCIVTIGRAYTFISPVFHEPAYSGRITGTFNGDFLALTGYLRSHPVSSRYLWMPMTFPDHVYISDRIPNHYYVGISPLQYMAASSDIAGFYGLTTPADPLLNWKILDLFKKGTYDRIGTIFASENIGYVIVNHDPVPAARQDFLNGFQFMDLQNDAYIRTLLGAKIRDFGSRYSLYRINERFAAPTVFLTDQVSGAPHGGTPVEFGKGPDGSYSVNIRELTKPSYLVLLEPYNRLWSVTDVGGKKMRLTQQFVYGYGNAWYLDPKQLGGAGTLSLTIQFIPRRYVGPAIVVSALAFVSAIGYIGLKLWKK